MPGSGLILKISTNGITFDQSNVIFCQGRSQCRHYILNSCVPENDEIKISFYKDDISVLADCLFEKGVASTRAISPRGLSHLKGCFADGFCNHFGERKRNISHSKIEDLLIGEPLVNPIGKKVLYSDVGFMILGWIVERVAGSFPARVGDPH